MTIKKLCIDEIPELVGLYSQLVPDEINKPQVSQEIYRSIADNDDYFVLVAKENEKIIGTVTAICCKSLALSGKSFLVVEDVVVEEGHKGKGIGRKLFKELDRIAHAKNCAYSILVSSGFREGAHTFYEKMGYVDDVLGFRKMYT